MLWKNRLSIPHVLLLSDFVNPPPYVLYFVPSFFINEILKSLVLGLRWDMVWKKGPDICNLASVIQRVFEAEVRVLILSQSWVKFLHFFKSFSLSIGSKPINFVLFGILSQLSCIIPWTLGSTRQHLLLSRRISILPKCAIHRIPEKDWFGLLSLIALFALIDLRQKLITFIWYYLQVLFNLFLLQASSSWILFLVMLLSQHYLIKLLIISFK